MAIPSYNTLPDIACPLLEQPDENMCIGELVHLLTYNMMVMERTLMNSMSPAGVISLYAGTTGSIPTKALICDGSVYNKTVFPNLFDAIGHLYRGGLSDEELHQSCFRVPDLRGTVLVGAELNASPTRTPFLGSWTSHSYDSGATSIPPNTDGTSGAHIKLSSEVYAPNTNLGGFEHVQLIPIISTGEACG